MLALARVAAARYDWAPAGWSNNQWSLSPNTYCGINKVPGTPVTWSGTFEECYQGCLQTPTCTEFAFTNATLYTVRTGCAYTMPCNATAPPCHAGVCANWDTYDCPSRDCAAPPPPPAPQLPFAVSAAFGSHMVLQRDTPARIYGTAGAGDIITVSVDVPGSVADAVRTTAFPNGTWAADLATRPATTTPSTLTVSSSGNPGGNLTLEDILWGDVWGCHGQSNVKSPESCDPFAAHVHRVTPCPFRWPLGLAKT